MTVRRRCDTSDAAIEMHPARRTVKASVTEREDAPVTSNQPIAAPVGRRRDSDDGRGKTPNHGRRTEQRASRAEREHSPIARHNQ